MLDKPHVTLNLGSAAVPAATMRPTLRSLLQRHLQLLVMVLALLLIAVVFSITTDGSYLSARNVSNLLRQTAITGILAIGMVFVIVSAEIDLSVGSMMGLLGGIAAILDVWFGWPLPFTIVLTLAAGLLLGLWNGWWVAYRKVPSFIVTLAGMLAFRGILIGITEGSTVAPTSSTMGLIGQSYLPDAASVAVLAVAALVILGWRRYQRGLRQQLQLPTPAISREMMQVGAVLLLVLAGVLLLNSYRGVPTPVLLLIVLMLAGGFVARKTLFGRHVYAIGGNLDASRLSGIDVARTKLTVFALNGVLVGVAALILCSRLGAGSPSAGNFAELDAIAACVIGGTSLAGGVGSIYRAVLGALIMSSLDNGMSMMDVPTFWQYIVKGAILLLAVWMDSATRRRA
ncbi:sugar ABC transporter permease [Pokkaliibacter plantistimulans]|nr:sugar ABC transporter permease [Pokkaliibacter plantistimulans]